MLLLLNPAPVYDEFLSVAVAERFNSTPAVTEKFLLVVSRKIHTALAAWRYQDFILLLLLFLHPTSDLVLKYFNLHDLMYEY